MGEAVLHVHTSLGGHHCGAVGAGHGHRRPGLRSSSGRAVLKDQAGSVKLCQAQIVLLKGL